MDPILQQAAVTQTIPITAPEVDLTAVQQAAAEQVTQQIQGLLLSLVMSQLGEGG